jgi:hypothetical protein
LTDQLAVARRTWIKIKNPPAAAIRNGLRSRRSAETHHFLLFLASLQRLLSLVVMAAVVSPCFKNYSPVVTQSSRS